MAVAAVLLIVPSAASAQESGSLGQWVRESGAHQIAGYATLGLSVTTATLGLLRVDVHPVFGAATATFSFSAATLGLIGYRQHLSYAWPHAVLNGVAATGFLLNAFAFEGGSRAHITSGLTATASVIGAVSYIIAVTD
jgi:hypothetical protein